MWCSVTRIVPTASDRGQGSGSGLRCYLHQHTHTHLIGCIVIQSSSKFFVFSSSVYSASPHQCAVYCKGGDAEHFYDIFVSHYQVNFYAVMCPFLWFCVGCKISNKLLLNKLYFWPFYSILLYFIMILLHCCNVLQLCSFFSSI